MNRWVVLLLVVLAFLAGTLSFRQGRVDPATVAASPPLASTLSPTPAADATVVAARTTRVPSRDPNFGVPPGKQPSATKPPLGSPRLGGAAISATVFASSVDGPSRTRFALDSGPIFLTVTPFAVPDKVELVAQYRNTLQENQPFSSPLQSSGPPRKRTFRLSPPASGWQSGPHQVVIKPSGSDQVLGLARFEIDRKDAPAEPQYAEPKYMDLVKNSADENASSVFTQTDPEVGLLVYTEGVPETVLVRTVWSAVDVDQLSAGEIVAVSEKAAPGPGQDAYFTFTPREGRFLPGSYRVDVYYDQQAMGSQAFFIQPASAPAASSSPPL